MHRSTWTLTVRDDVAVAHLGRADRLLARMRGLLGREQLGPDEGLWITPCPSIHMWFMRFAIDAVFIDRDFRVVRVIEALQPWGMARGGRGAHSVLELSVGTIARAGITVGETVAITSHSRDSSAPKPEQPATKL
ncbi:MAG: hypothetical protein JWN41_1516 [Thermoleophilia bacterium]|nr:hypothetical protein [Thermoleophilia bacterium]